MTTPVEPEVSEQAAAWLPRVEAIAEGMFVHLTGRIDAIERYPELRGLTKASCSSNVEAMLSMILNAIPATAAEAPVTALEHARAMAKRGAGIDDTLRFYRLGLGWTEQQWVADLSTRIDDRARLLAAIEQSSAFMVEYVDIVSSRVSAEHLAERERRQRRTALMRADLVRALLSGEAVDPAAAERTLGHRLDRPQLAYVCWTADGSGQELERTALAVAAAVGDARPLLVAEDADVLGGWASPGSAVDRTLLDAALSGGAVAAAFGSVGSGLDGFRRSRLEADRARRVAELMGAGAGVGGAGRAVHFADVALLDLLTSDLDAAHAFVRAQLGELARTDEATAAVRRTLLLVLEPRGGIAAAARTLDVHRNTVLQRVHRAETLLGRPVDERAVELHLALLLRERLGPPIR